MGMGVGGWGFGDWGLVIGPNPQSPIPNPQSPIPNPQILNPYFIKFNFYILLLNLFLNILYKKVIFFQTFVEKNYIINFLKKI